MLLCISNGAWCFEDKNISIFSKKMARFKPGFQLLLSNNKSKDKHFLCLVLLALKKKKKQVPCGQRQLGELLK